MTNNTCKLSYVKPYKGNDMIFVGNGNALPISHVGNACVFTKEGKFKLNDVLVVTHLKKNLLSVGKFTSDNSCTFECTSFDFVVKDQK